MLFEEVNCHPKMRPTNTSICTHTEIWSPGKVEAEKYLGSLSYRLLLSTGKDLKSELCLLPRHTEVQCDNISKRTYRFKIRSWVRHGSHRIKVFIRTE